MTTTTRPMTAEDLWNMPDNGGRHELIQGELRSMSPANPRHGFVAFRIGALLDRWVTPRKLGALFAAETGFIIARNPDTLYAPDVAFVSADRIPADGIPEKFFPGPPDLAVEVLSPNDAWRDVEEKARAYLAAGTRLVWIVNPRAESVTVFQPGPAVHVCNKTDNITAERLFPGFSQPVADFFA